MNRALLGAVPDLLLPYLAVIAVLTITPGPTSWESSALA